MNEFNPLFFITIAVAFIFISLVLYSNINKTDIYASKKLVLAQELIEAQKEQINSLNKQIEAQKNLIAQFEQNLEAKDSLINTLRVFSRNRLIELKTQQKEPSE